MFTLRKIAGAGKGIEQNFCLGNYYTLVTNENDPEKVKECKEKGIIADDPIIYGYVVGEDLELYELSVQQRNYIMTGNGKTFDNLSI